MIYMGPVRLYTILHDDGVVETCFLTRSARITRFPTRSLNDETGRPLDTVTCVDAIAGAAFTTAGPSVVEAI